MDLISAIKMARRVYLIGNGGSYANAVHIQNDLISCGIRAHTLDPSTLTATANDFGYEFIFSKWLMTFGEPGDLLIALSGSGKSKNILNAIEAAKLIGMEVCPLFGAPEFNMQEAEERHVRLGHEVMKALKCG